MSGMVSSFGSDLRTWRVAEGLSLRDLASLLGLSEVQVGAMERGKDEDSLAGQWPRIVYDLTRLGFRRTP